MYSITLFAEYDEYFAFLEKTNIDHEVRRQYISSISLPGLHLISPPKVAHNLL